MRRFGIGAFVNVRSWHIGIEPIEETRKQNSAGTVETLQMSKVDIDRVGASELRLRIRNGFQRGRGMRKIERPRWRDASVISISYRSDLDVHARTLVPRPPAIGITTVRDRLA